MEAPPLEQAAAASAPASSTTSASAPSLTPPPNPPTTGTATAAPLTSVFTTITPTPNTGTASNPAQTLEPPATNPATARPPAPRMRSPYTHLASPITMSSSSAHAGSGASASPASIPASSPATSATPRRGVVLGIPAPRPGQKHVSYTELVPQPPLAHQFEPMHRRSDQSPSSPSQFRQPSPGIQNIVIVNSVSSSQMRPGLTSGPQQPSPGIPLSTTVTTPISSGSQMTGSQRPPARAITRSMSMTSPPLQQPLQNTSSSFRPQQRPQLPQPRPQQSASAPLHQQDMVSAQQGQRPQHQLLQQKQVQQQSTSHQNQQNAALRNQLQLSQQQAARAPVSTAQKPDIPSAPNVVMQSVDTITTDTDAGENGNRLVTKRSICELVSQIDPNEKLDPEVEDVLIDIAEDFVESVASFACSLAKHRKSDTLEAKDVLLHAEKSWNIILPGFSGDEIKLYKKQHVSDIHRERLSLVKKSMVSDTKAQAAANQKNQTPKPPAPGSP